MKTISLLTILLLSVSIYSQSIIKTVPNDRANLKITDWIANVPKDKNLNNKFIILNFWRTGCVECAAFIKQTKHLNELQSKFKNSDLYFITLTNEKPEVVKKYLKAYDFMSIVASDQRKTNSFWNDGMEKILTPVTVLIDNSGIVKYILMPDDLNENIIKSLINGTLEPFDAYKKLRR